MDRDSARKAAEVMLAYADGKEIEYKDFDDKYHPVEEKRPTFNWGKQADTYRIKPTPTYRPFANAEECWEEMKKHEPFGWVRDKDNERYFTITCVSNENITLALNGGLSPAKVAEYYTFADGSVFGKLTEEE